MRKPARDVDEVLVGGCGGRGGGQHERREHRERDDQRGGKAAAGACHDHVGNQTDRRATTGRGYRGAHGYGSSPRRAADRARAARDPGGGAARGLRGSLVQVERRRRDPGAVLFPAGGPARVDHRGDVRGTVARRARSGWGATARVHRRLRLGAADPGALAVGGTSPSPPPLRRRCCFIGRDIRTARAAVRRRPRSDRADARADPRSPPPASRGARRRGDPGRRATRCRDAPRCADRVERRRAREMSTASVRRGSAARSVEPRRARGRASRRRARAGVGRIAAARPDRRGVDDRHRRAARRNTASPAPGCVARGGRSRSPSVAGARRPSIAALGDDLDRFDERSGEDRSDPGRAAETSG